MRCNIQTESGCNLKPYYESAGIAIYNGDCREVIPQLDGRGFDLLLTDPPFGIGAARYNFGGAGVKRHVTGLCKGTAVPKTDYGDAAWDDSPADIATIRSAQAITRHHIIWGGNYFDLGPARCYLVWDKLRGDTDFADAELAWTNLDRAVRVIRHRWNGFLQEDMKHKEKRVHPTQKPLRVTAWAISQAPSGCRTIFDPYAGSGTTLRAAKDMGLSAVGVERVVV